MCRERTLDLRIFAANLSSCFASAAVSASSASAPAPAPMAASLREQQQSFRMVAAGLDVSLVPEMAVNHNRGNNSGHNGGHNFGRNAPFAGWARGAQLTTLQNRNEFEANDDRQSKHRTIPNPGEECGTHRTSGRAQECATRPLGNTSRLMARGGCWGLRMPTHHGSASAPTQRLKVLSSARPAAFRYRNNCMR